MKDKRIAFGPIPSRRLGRSLGINNIFAKTCPYSCVYCQVGKTVNMTTKRKVFFKPEMVFSEVKKKVEKASSRIDYLTFVSDGEPSLDLNLGKEISLLKQIGVPIAVLTNSSLLWQKDVREDLQEANLVSLKVDSLSEDLWKRVNRPHKKLKLNRIFKGIIEFVEEFEGVIISETMLVNKIEYGDEFGKIADFLSQLERLDKAYIAIPTRPPAVKCVEPADEETVNHAFQVFAEKLGSEKVEYLIGYEGNSFGFTGNVEEDLLSILAIHPMREEAVKEFLKRANAEWVVVQKLLDDAKIMKLEYRSHKYFMKKLPGRE